MYGVLIAFKDYKFKLGILKSPWTDNFGLWHFIRFFSSQSSWTIIKNTLILSIWSLIWGFPAPIVLAILLNECKLTRYKKVVQTVSYMPHFISVVAIVGMMTLLLSPRDGAINNVIKGLGFQPIYFMAETRWFRPVYVISNIWQGAGFGAIIYLAALSNVSVELYEAATIDGASRIQRIWHVSIPGILPTITILLILSAGNILDVSFEKTLLMQNGLNIGVSEVIDTFVYKVGLLGGEFSYSTAVGLFKTTVGLIMLIVVNRVSSWLSETALW
jgi:putative aldouronate transport system permease protein